MPFKSPRQRRYLYAKHPEIARRWSAEEKAVSKMDPRYGAGGGSHGSRIIEKSEDSKHRARRNAAIGAGVGTAVGHQAITGGLATRGVNNFLRSESPHLSKPARYAMSGAAGTAAAWHPSTLLSAARTPKYLALLAPGAIAGGVIGARKKKKVAKADKIGEIHRAAKARRSLGQAFGDEVLMPAAHKVMGPKYVKPGKGKLNAEERRQQGLWMAQGYPVNKADWMGIEEHKRRAAGSRRTRNRGYTVGGASLGAAAAMAGAMPGSVSELRDISRTARARVVPTRHGEEMHEFRIKDGHMGMSPGMRARNVVRSAKVRPGGALVGGALGLTADRKSVV